MSHASPPRDVATPAPAQGGAFALRQGVTRREFKYLLPHVHGALAVSRVHRSVPLLTREHAPRQVSSIYFDSASYDCYRQSNSGDNERVKLRMRWYGDGLVVTPVLELKHRANHMGWKGQHSLPSMELGALTFGELRERFRACVTPREQALVDVLRFPVLIATYHRHYLVTPDRRIRVTVDTALRFIDQRNRRRPNLQFDRCEADFSVVECKLDAEHEPAARALLRNFGTRHSRFSKYCFGVGALARG